MNGRKALPFIAALGIVVLVFWLMRARFQSRIEPMEAPPSPADQQEIKKLFPENSATTQKKK